MCIPAPMPAQMGECTCLGVQEMNGSGNTLLITKRELAVGVQDVHLLSRLCMRLMPSHSSYLCHAVPSMPLPVPRYAQCEMVTAEV